MIHQQFRTISIEETLENHLNVETEQSAPLCNLDIEEWLDSFSEEETNECHETECSNITKNRLQTNLIESIDICNSLEDLVKTFDQNVKKCLSNYKDIDIGQLAPVQVRSQDQVINDSQMWYTLTGNFGNLLPIDYGSTSLYKKYHKDSLDIKDNKKKHQSSKKIYEDFDDEYDEFGGESNFSYTPSERNSDDKESDFEFDNDSDCDKVSDYDDENEEEDEHELREQLDMHSMILSKSFYNENGDLDEPCITADEVLNEIESMMTMQEELYDEMTPDSGCFSVHGLNQSTEGSQFNPELPIDVNGSYITYIKTFALHETSNQSSFESGTSNMVKDVEEETTQVNITNKTDFTQFNIYELNDLIEQIEQNTKILSDSLVEELDLREELDFEKETKNTFISLLMSIQEKRRFLNSETMSSSVYNTRGSNALKKKHHRRSMINLDSKTSTHLTTIIPYNNEVEYTVQHLEILNKLLKAIDEDSNQVPELLTNYILKVVCPT